MAIVWPAPSPAIEPNWMSSIPYAVRICWGVYPPGDALPRSGVTVAEGSDGPGRDGCGRQDGREPDLGRHDACLHFFGGRAECRSLPTTVRAGVLSQGGHATLHSWGKVRRRAERGRGPRSGRISSVLPARRIDSRPFRPADHRIACDDMEVEGGVCGCPMVLPSREGSPWWLIPSPVPQEDHPAFPKSEASVAHESREGVRPPIAIVFPFFPRSLHLSTSSTAPRRIPLRTAGLPRIEPIQESRRPG